MIGSAAAMGAPTSQEHKGPMLKSFLRRRGRAAAGPGGEPVVAAVGGPEVVIRQVTLPPLPAARIIPALEMQYRDLGLHPPDESVLDAQILRSDTDNTTNEVLSVSVPRLLVDERTQLLRQAAVNVQVLDVEPLAILNGALQLTGMETGGLLAG